MDVKVVVDDGVSKEDSFFAGENLFAVFDGFSILEKFVDSDGRTRGQIASAIAREVFSKKKGDLKTLAIEANKRIEEKMRAVALPVDAKNKNWGTAFAAVKISKNYFEWAQIADSLVMTIFNDGSFRLLVEDYNHDMQVLEQWKKFAEEKKKNIRELIVPEIIKNRERMNVAYGGLNGDSRAAKFIKSGKESLDNVKHILIFTDGLFIPKKNPSEKDDWSLFVKLFLEGGLDNVKDYVRGLEKKDPNCWMYPRFKQYDDITAVSLTF